MALIFTIAYHHHDPGLLTPVWNELKARGHNIVKGQVHLQAFLETGGPKVALLVSDIDHPAHSPGQEVTRRCRESGIRSVTIQHGIPLNAEIHYHTADVICLWGEYWKGKYITRESEVVTGNPEMDVLKSIDRQAEREKAREHFGAGPWALLVPGLRTRIDVGAVKGMDLAARAEYYINEARSLDWKGQWMVRPHPTDLRVPDHMAAYKYICRNVPAKLQRPDEASLPMALFASDLVMGTSSVVLESLVYDCQAVPLAMPFVPERPTITNCFLRRDGKAAQRIADVVEANLV